MPKLHLSVILGAIWEFNTTKTTRRNSCVS